MLMDMFRGRDSDSFSFCAAAQGFKNILECRCAKVALGMKTREK